MLPAFKHAKNCELAALVSDDAEKARKVGKMYGVTQFVDYDDYDALPGKRRRRRGLHRAAESSALRLHGARRQGRRACAVREADGGDRGRVQSDDHGRRARRRQADDRLPPALRGSEPAGDRRRCSRARSASRACSTRRSRCRWSKTTSESRANWAAARSTTSASTASTRRDTCFATSRSRSWPRASTAAIRSLRTSMKRRAPCLRFPGDRLASFTSSFGVEDVDDLPHRRDEGRPARRAGLSLRRRDQALPHHRRQD